MSETPLSARQIRHGKPPAAQKRRLERAAAPQGARP